MKRLKILLQSKAFFLLSLFFLILYIFVATKVIAYSSMYKETVNEFVGIVIDKKIDGDKFSFILKAKEKIQVTYYFKSLDEKNKFLDNIKLGQTLKVNGTLTKPSNNTIPNTFNYKNYLYNKRIYWILSANKIDILDKKIPIHYNIKNYFISRVNKYTDTSSYLYAFILGDSGYIDSDVYNNFQNNGVTHLFAVSGMHIGLFIMVFNRVLKKLHFKDNMISYIIIMFFGFYLFLVGFSASVVRATMFYMLLFLNKRFNWNFKSIRLFYFLFLILLIVNPFYIYDIGFIYSFITSLGLMLYSKKLTGNYFIKLLKTSLIAFLFSLPITIYFNYEFNLMTIFNNLVIVPMVSLVLFPLSLLTFVVPFLEIFLKIGFTFLEFINNLLSYFSLNIVIGKVSLIFLISYYSIIFLGFKKFYWYFLIILLLFIAKYKFCLDSNSYVYYLDVGQGDATLLISKYHEDIVLIDSGGKIEYEKEEWQRRNSSFSLADTLAQFMKSIGITKVNLFIGTHGDKDHIGYAIDLFNIIKCEKLMLNNNDYNSEEKKLLQLIPKQIKNSYKGKNIYLQNLNTNVLSNENDSSLVLFTNILDKNYLFMGDAPKLVEQNIINKYKIKVDILKVGHHGSNTSSDYDFLKAIDPKIAIISCGRNNRYNHPSIETIQNLEKLKINYYNTQNKGTIELKLNNKEKYIFYEP